MMFLISEDFDLKVDFKKKSDFICVSAVKLAENTCFLTIAEMQGQNKLVERSKRAAAKCLVSVGTQECCAVRNLKQNK